MLLDSSHSRWSLVTLILTGLALGGYFSLAPAGGLKGGSTPGLWYGIIGSALMVYAGLLAAHRKVPTWWWIGPRKTWLRGHIWLGLLSLIFILCHSGFHTGGLLTKCLWVVFAGTLLTGIHGLAVQQFVPRMMTTRIVCEAPYEQIPHLCKRMAGRANQLMNTVWEADVQATQMSMRGSQLGMGAKVQLQEFYEAQVLPFLSQQRVSGLLLSKQVPADTAFARLKALPGLANVKEQVEELELLCGERRLLAEQERLHHLLHGWLLIHVPLSLALLVLGIAHIIGSLYY